MAAGSSAVEDQLALLQDRIDCLGELTTNIVSTNNIELNMANNMVEITSAVGVV